MLSYSIRLLLLASLKQVRGNPPSLWIRRSPVKIWKCIFMGALMNILGMSFEEALNSVKITPQDVDITI